MENDDSLGLNDREISESFSSTYWAERYPPILSIEKAAEFSISPWELFAIGVRVAF